MKIEWTGPAVSDLESIQAYIAKDSPYYAAYFIRQLIDLAEGLASFPRRGRVVPELGLDSFRELLFHNYRLIYSVEPDRVLILAIVHTKRDLSKRSREAKRVASPRAYQRWSEDEDTLLEAGFLQGLTIQELAARLGRQPGAVRSRLQKLGLMSVR